MSSSPASPPALLSTTLGIRPESTLVLLGAPDAFDLDLPEGVTVRTRAGGRADAVLAFFVRASVLDRRQLSRT